MQDNYDLWQAKQIVDLKLSSGMPSPVLKADMQTKAGMGLSKEKARRIRPGFFFAIGGGGGN